MSTFKETSTYLPEVAEGSFINVKRIDKVFKDDVVISESIHRHVLAPGDDLTNEDAVVIAVAKAVWTDEVIAAYKATLSTTEVRANETTA